MYRIQEAGKCYLLLILTQFYEHIHLGESQSLRESLCFSSRCKELISTYSWSKNNLNNDCGNIIAYWEESAWSEGLANKCQQWWNLAAVQSQENVYPRLPLETVLPALKLLKMSYIININTEFPIHHIYVLWKTIFTIW